MTTTAASGSQALPEALGAYQALLDRLGTGANIDAGRSALVDEATIVWSRPGFETLLSEPSFGFTPFDYQLQTAQTVLRRMRGRAILADEVGLGKTIEAGLVLSELRARGMAGRALVLTPAGLVEQWREELERKFALPTTVARGRNWDAPEGGPVVLASIATARRDPTRTALVSDPWDVIVVDEAHRVRNARSASGKLARSLSSRYLLLLTATPVENRLQDLYELVSLVAPGLLGTPIAFRRRHVGSGDRAMPEPRNVAELRARTREVMIRHRRSEVELMLPQRLADTVLVTPEPDEAELYRDIITRIRAEARETSARHRLTLRALTRLAGSSPAAVMPTLEKVGWTDLADRARSIRRTTKTTALLNRLRSHVETEEKVVVFTAFRQTQATLAELLERAGVPAAVYHGSLARQDKEKAIAAFRDEVPVLLTTESAGEGRNLQFCHVMVNMDLPWNPMQIEQRLGRLHRVGQQHDVVLTNLVARGTIEQRILHVLEAKINLFELVVGELDMILGHVDDDFDFESTVFDAFVDSADERDFAERLETLGDQLTQARAGYLSTRSAVDALVSEG